MNSDYTDITKEKLNKIIENHKHWYEEDCVGWKEMCADLCGADLCGADLCGVMLRGASLYEVNLRCADLEYANLGGANLHGANLDTASLRYADLGGTNLYVAYLYKADLNGANLRDANLCGADLRHADLSGADLRHADLYKADLRDADLSDANLRDANLCDADLSGAKNIPFIPYACPTFGSFVGFKKASGYIVMLEIPEDAKRLSATSLKCRCNKAKVLEIQNIDGSTSKINKIASDHDRGFIYKVGEIVSVDDFDENRWNECSTGIHFFINRRSAVEY